MGNEKYIKGFNDGYLLKKYKPQLLENILNITSTNDYIQGLKDGERAHSHKKLRSREQEINKIKLNRDRSQEKGLER